MSYTLDITHSIVARGQLDYASSTALYIGLALEGTSLATGNYSASDRSQIPNLNECNYGNYTLKNLTGVSVSLDTTAHEARFRFDPVVWTNLGTSVATPVVGAWIQLHASTTTGRVLHYFDTAPLFPFRGGGDRVIVAPQTGAVRFKG